GISVDVKTDTGFQQWIFWSDFLFFMTQTVISLVITMKNNSIYSVGKKLEQKGSFTSFYTYSKQNEHPKNTSPSN
ncbi:hypothetical protein H5410_023892, partial [Solanum commersonii]